MGISQRTMRRAFERYGEIVYRGRVGKHSPRKRDSGKFSYGGRTPAKGVSQGRDMSLSIYSGQLKLRELWLRAGILISKIEGDEMRSLLVDAKAEYECAGVIPVDIELKLTLSGYVIDELTDLWDITAALADDKGVLDAITDTPLNSFN
jgi:hypothetical protein